MKTSGLLQRKLCKRPEVFMIPWTFQKSNLFLKYILWLQNKTINLESLLLNIWWLYGLVNMIHCFLASGNFCRQLITLANSLDLDQDRQNISSDLDPKCRTLWLCSWKNLVKRMKIYPECKDLTANSTGSLPNTIKFSRKTSCFSNKFHIKVNGVYQSIDRRVFF